MFEKLFKCVDWRHSFLLSESILQKVFKVYDFLVILCKILVLLLSFSCFFLCVFITSSSRLKKPRQILIITVWKNHRSLEDHCITQINHGRNFLRLKVL